MSITPQNKMPVKLFVQIYSSIINIIIRILKIFEKYGIQDAYIKRF